MSGRLNFTGGRAERSSAAVSAREAFGAGAPEPAPLPTPPAAPPTGAPPPPARQVGAVAPAAGPYLGGAAGDTAHRVSFSVRGDRVRNLRIDGRQMASSARIANGRLRDQHMGFAVTAEWIDEHHVEGTVRMRGRWGRGVSFSFTARRRVGDVLSG